MHLSSVTVTLEVSDVAEGQRWYGDLLGEMEQIRPVDGIWECEVHQSVWLQLVSRQHGHELAHLRLGVKNLDLEHQRLTHRGIAPSEIVAHPLSEGGASIRVCYFSDPWSNRLCLYEVVA